MRRIGVTLGEPCGIGPELVVRTVPQVREDKVQFILYGSPNLLEKLARDCNTRPFWSLHSAITDSDRIVLKPAGPDPKDGIFVPDDPHTRADAVLAMLDEASKDALSGEISALVTAPIDKSIVRTKLPAFSGHTEYLKERAGVPRTVMMMDNKELRVALFTHHIPLRDVPGAMSVEMIQDVVRLTAKTLAKQYGIRSPRFSIAGLNPHAGETVEHSEEETIFKPAIQQLRKEGFEIEGPFSADSLFNMARGNNWDVVFSPYHDQGLVAAKYGGLDKVVNITLGLPYLRVSPGHGVAYDLAGKRQADIRSFERALRIAAKGRWIGQ